MSKTVFPERVLVHYLEKYDISVHCEINGRLSAERAGDKRPILIQDLPKYILSLAMLTKVRLFFAQYPVTVANYSLYVQLSPYLALRGGMNRIEAEEDLKGLPVLDLESEIEKLKRMDISGERIDVVSEMTSGGTLGLISKLFRESSLARSRGLEPIDEDLCCCFAYCAKSNKPAVQYGSLKYLSDLLEKHLVRPKSKQVHYLLRIECLLRAWITSDDYIAKLDPITRLMSIKAYLLCLEAIAFSQLTKISSALYGKINDAIQVFAPKTQTPSQVAYNHYVWGIMTVHTRIIARVDQSNARVAYNQVLRLARPGAELVDRVGAAAPDKLEAIGEILGYISSGVISTATCLMGGISSLLGSALNPPAPPVATTATPKGANEDKEGKKKDGKDKGLAANIKVLFRGVSATHLLDALEDAPDWPSRGYQAVYDAYERYKREISKETSEQALYKQIFYLKRRCASKGISSVDLAIIHDIMLSTALKTNEQDNSWHVTFSVLEFVEENLCSSVISLSIRRKIVSIIRDIKAYTNIPGLIFKAFQILSKIRNDYHLRQDVEPILVELLDKQTASLTDMLDREEQIVREIRDHEIFLSLLNQGYTRRVSLAAKCPNALPLPRLDIDSCIKRQAECGLLSKLFNKRRPVAMCGIKHVGKTFLARQYIELYHHQYSKIYFLQSWSQVEDLKTELELEGPSHAELRDKLENANQRWLLILDFGDETLPPGEERAWIPNGKEGGDLLILANNRAYAFELGCEEENTIILTPAFPSDARDYLLSGFKQKHSIDAKLQNDTLQICERLLHWPPSIAQLRREIVRNGNSPAEVLGGLSHSTEGSTYYSVDQGRRDINTLIELLDATPFNGLTSRDVLVLVAFCDTILPEDVINDFIGPCDDILTARNSLLDPLTNHCFVERQNCSVRMNMSVRRLLREITTVDQRISILSTLSHVETMRDRFGRIDSKSLLCKIFESLYKKTKEAIIGSPQSFKFVALFNELQAEILVAEQPSNWKAHAEQHYALAIDTYTSLGDTEKTERCKTNLALLHHNIEEADIAESLGLHKAELSEDAALLIKVLENINLTGYPLLKALRVLRHLDKAVMLRSLNICSTSLGQPYYQSSDNKWLDGLKVLAELLPQLPVLTTLQLDYANIDHEGVQTLAPKLPHGLTKLNLRLNQIGVKGAKFLAECLPDLTNLVVLELKDCFIETEGAKALAQYLPSLKKLITLGLGGNKIGSAGAQDIVAILPDLHALASLDLSNAQVDNNIVKLLAKSLLQLSGFTSLTECGDGTKGSELILTGNEIEVEGAQALGDILPRLQGLTALNLSFNPIGSGGVKVLLDGLQTQNNLVQLKLAASEIGDEGAQQIVNALPSLPSLRSLDLQANNITDNALQELINTVLTKTGIHKLDLRHNKPEDAEGMRKILEKAQSRDILI